MQKPCCQFGHIAASLAALWTIAMTVSSLAHPAHASLQTSSSDTNQPDALSESESTRKRFDRIYSEDTDCALTLGFDGSINVFTVNASKSFQTPLPLLRLLSDDVVASHLGLVDYQLDQIADTATELEEALSLAQSILNERTGAFDVGIQQQILDILEPPIAVSTKIVEDVLLPHQIVPLERALRTYQIRRIGLHAVLSGESMGNALGISPAQRKQLDEVFQTKGKDAIQRLLDEQAATIEDLISVLTKTQRENMELALGTVFLDSPVTPTLFRLQLGADYQNAFTSSQNEKDLLECVETAEQVWFSLTLDASVSCSEPDSQSFTNTGLILFAVLQDPLIGRSLGMSDDQNKMARMLIDSFYQEINELCKQEFAAAQVVGGDWRSDYQKKIVGYHDRLGKELRTKLDSLLLPFQRSQLRQILFAILFRKLGIVGGLNNAPKELFSLSADQKRELTRKAATALEKLEELAVSEERQLNNHLLNVLTREQRDLFRELTLPELSLESGQIDFHQYFRHPSVLKKMMLQHEFLNRLMSAAVAEKREH